MQEVQNINELSKIFIPVQFFKYLFGQNFKLICCMVQIIINSIFFYHVRMCQFVKEKIQVATCAKLCLTSCNLFHKLTAYMTKFT